MKNFSACHPAVNFVYYISVITFTVIFRHPIMLLIAFLTSFIYNLKLSGKKSVRFLASFLLPLILFTAAVNVLTVNYGQTVLFILPWNGRVCLEPLIYGIMTGVSASAVMLIFSNYNQTVSSDKILNTLGRYLPSTAMLLTLSLRFIPTYKQRLKSIAEAQKVLFKGTEDDSFFNKLKSGARIISVLISAASESSVKTADSMKNRGYGIRGRTNYCTYQFTVTDILLMILFLLSDAVIILGIFAGVTQTSYDPVIKIHEFTPFSAAVHAVFAFELLLPFIFDTWEDIKWKKSLK